MIHVCHWLKNKCGKRRKCWLPVFSPFSTASVFQKLLLGFWKSGLHGLLIEFVWCSMPFSTVFQLCHGGQCTYPCFPGVLLTRHNILSKPLAAFLCNHCQNNGQRWERNESSRNDYHQSSKRVFSELGIESATSCSQVRKIYGAWQNLHGKEFNGINLSDIFILEFWSK